MSRLLWVLGYAYRAFRSPYVFTPLEAWGEGWASYDVWKDETPDGEVMPTPAQALYEDQYEWIGR